MKQKQSSNETFMQSWSFCFYFGEICFTIRPLYEQHARQWAVQHFNSYIRRIRHHQRWRWPLMGETMICWLFLLLKCQVDDDSNCMLFILSPFTHNALSFGPFPIYDWSTIRSSLLWLLRQTRGHLGARQGFAYVVPFDRTMWENVPGGV